MRMRKRLPNPLVRQAVALQGFEEARHADLLRRDDQALTGLLPKSVPSMRPLSTDLRRAFADFGYGECVDSFLVLAFSRSPAGLASCPSRCSRFRYANPRGDPAQSFFFINWMAWQQASRGVPRRLAARRDCRPVL